MKKKVGPSINWIAGQFTKAVEELISGTGDIRSRMRAATHWIYGFDPEGIPNDRLKRKVIAFRVELKGKYPDFKHAINVRQFATLSNFAIRLWNLHFEIHDLVRTMLP